MTSERDGRQLKFLEYKIKKDSMENLIFIRLIERKRKRACVNGWQERWIDGTITKDKIY